VALRNTTTGDENEDGRVRRRQVEHPWCREPEDRAIFLQVAIFPNFTNVLRLLHLHFVCIVGIGQIDFYLLKLNN
jgi:hypothetical protein